MVDTPGRITLWGIEVFVITAEEGALQNAATRLGISVSTVSQQLSSLEAALGTALLNRKQRPVRLTPGGEVFLRHAKRILREADQARAGLALADLSQFSRVRLGMIDDFETDVTPALLQDMSAELTQSRFLLETGPSHHLLALLEAHELDLIVAAEPEEPSDLRFSPVLIEGFVMAAPKGRLREGELPQALADLPLIQISERLQMGRLIRAHLAKEGVELPYRFQIDSYHAALALVAEGIGWTILTPLALARAARFAPALDIFPLPFAPLRRQISVISRDDSLGAWPEQIAATLRGLVDHHIRQKLQDQPLLADALVMR